MPYIEDIGKYLQKKNSKNKAAPTGKKRKKEEKGRQCKQIRLGEDIAILEKWSYKVTQKSFQTVDTIEWVYQDFNLQVSRKGIFEVLDIIVVC